MERLLRAIRDRIVQFWRWAGWILRFILIAPLIILGATFAASASGDMALAAGTALALNLLCYIVFFILVNPMWIAGLLTILGITDCDLRDRIVNHVRGIGRAGRVTIGLYLLTLNGIAIVPVSSDPGLAIVGLLGLAILPFFAGRLNERLITGLLLLQTAIIIVTLILGGRSAVSSTASTAKTMVVTTAETLSSIAESKKAEAAIARVRANIELKRAEESLRREKEAAAKPDAYRTLLGSNTPVLVSLQGICGPHKVAYFWRVTPGLKVKIRAAGGKLYNIDDDLPGEDPEVEFLGSYGGVIAIKCHS